MDEHDPLNLDATAHLDPEVEAEKAQMLKSIAFYRAQIEVPRYAAFFADPRLCDKALLVNNLTWAEEHIRRDGQTIRADGSPEDEGEFSLDVARTKLAYIKDTYEVVTERVDDWISDLDWA